MNLTAKRRILSQYSTFILAGILIGLVTFSGNWFYNYEASMKDWKSKTSNLQIWLQTERTCLEL